jgi:hypothetical protein
MAGDGFNRAGGHVGGFGPDDFEGKAGVEEQFEHAADQSAGHAEVGSNGERGGGGSWRA